MERMSRNYIYINNLTCRNIVTSFPDSESDEMLTNQFADYFMEKIREVRARLEEYPIYIPHDTAKAFMSKFDWVTESEVARLGIWPANHVSWMLFQPLH